MYRIVYLTSLILFLSACVRNVSATPPTTAIPSLTETPTAGTVTPSVPPTQTSPASPTADLDLPVSITVLAPQPTIFPTPLATLVPDPGDALAGHAVALRIHNLDKLTGRADQQTRWLAWGAPTFTIAPDGSYWLPDLSNGQQRLVHLSPSGDLLSMTPLNTDIPLDIAASRDFVYLRDGSNYPDIHILQFDAQGKPLKTFVLPVENTLFERITGLAIGERGELLLELFSGLFVYQLLDPSGQFDLRELPGYQASGRLYRFTTNDTCQECLRAGPPYSEACASCNLQGPVFIDDRLIDIAGIEQNNFMSFLGVAPDGSFYVVGRTHAEDRLVQHYAPDGRHLGYARPPQSHLPVEIFDVDLAIGPDSALYSLVSLPDQDVAILRLDFTDQVPVFPTPTLSPEVTPMLPISPAWETPPVGASAQEIAQQTLIAFFFRLFNRQFVEAAPLYAGGMEAFAPACEQYPEACTQLAGLESDPNQFWEMACNNLLACFPIGDIIEVEQVSENEFRFWVELSWEQYRYTAHACCGGNPAYTPFMWLFPYTVKEIEGRYQVMQPPPLLE